MGTKYLEKPCGSFEILSVAVKQMSSQSDIQLMEEYVQRCKHLADPFLFQEMVNRGLVFKGDEYRDVCEVLYRLKSGR